MFDYKQPVSDLRFFDNPGVHQADWSKLIQEAVEKGDVVAWSVESCDTCDKTFLIDNYGGGLKCIEMDGHDGCEGYVGTFEGPMMNAWHACGDIKDPQEAARSLAGLPLCLVN